MLAHTARTPPLSLHSPGGRGSSTDSTPISTPVTTGYSYHQRSWTQPDRNYTSRNKRTFEDSFLSSDDLLFATDEEEDAAHITLFPPASPHTLDLSMPGPASPINIATSRHSSHSPRNRHSNLMSQLQNPKIDVQDDPTLDQTNHVEPELKNRQESVGMLGTTPYGGRSIPKQDGRRRGSSNTGLSGSFMNGMSWGGISMNNFIQDDLMMTGTSPYNFQSPSFHSSSYLPKMEANYMKDYVCCDIHLDSMHELLQHYEEAHAAQPNQTIGRTPKDQQFPSTRAANATSTAQAVQQQSHVQQSNMAQTLPHAHGTNLYQNTSPMFSGQSQDHIGTFGNLDDMDMDDSMNTQQSQQSQHGSQFQPQPQFGRQQPRGPSLDVNLANAFQGSGLRSSTPQTPHINQQNYPGNPTVSSVNTPSLSHQTALSQQTSTPETSMPGTPAESDQDYSSQLNYMNNDFSQLGNIDFNSLNLNNNGGATTIDDPAKRLLSKQNAASRGFPNQSGPNGELAKRVREQSLLNGLSGPGGFVGEETKPFRCPVIGCEKAYKNQNGLKYHKQHGHQNQQLKENTDGSFSIVDPATSIPYPGTVGMEKEKPYRCDVCGKRYKNLNGLKYHRQHSPHCNPELKLSPAIAAGIPNNLQGAGVNVAGGGLMGMDNGIGY